MKNNKSFSYFCLSLLVFCLVVILWGAWVRISHSGDGCGMNWPDCHNQYFLDKNTDKKTWTEWIHRASTALFGLMVLALNIWAFFKFPKKHILRKSSLTVLFFTITEALIGAGLVKFGLTGAHFSLARILVMSFHLINSLLLAGSLFMCWRFSLKNNLQFSFSHRKYFLSFIFIFFIIAFFGSLSALSATLFPSDSLVDGFLKDFQSDSHVLVRLRWLHPVLALLLGGGFAGYCHKFFKTNKEKKDKALILFTACLGLALVSGLLNLFLLSPVFLKLSHLLIVYLLAFSFLLALEKPS